MSRRIKKKDAISLEQNKNKSFNDSNSEKNNKKPLVENIAIIGGLIGLLGAFIGLITAIITFVPNIVAFFKPDNNAPSIPSSSIPFSSSPLNILVPLYVNPGGNGFDLWNEIIDSSNNVPITVIVNPSRGGWSLPSGIGSCPESIYNDAITKLLDSGVKTIGYVDTQEGKRDINQVKADIDIYLNCYHVNGVFIESKYAATKENFNYYYALFWYTRHTAGAIDRVPQPLFFLGAGNNPSNEYYTEITFDTAVIFDGVSSPAWADYSLKNYTNKKHLGEPYTYTAALIHSAPDITTMQFDINKAVERHINYIYVTDDVMNNPWDSLPSYWRSEVDYIREINSNLQSTAQP